MIPILRSPFHPELKDGRYIDTLWGDIHFKPPKLIVGISLTTPEEDEFPSRGVPTFPAILDTGYNRTLEIDERHLVEPVFFDHWISKLNPRAFNDNSGIRRTYYKSPVHIWLHRLPYLGPEMEQAHPTRKPVLLKKTKLMRVMVRQTENPWPPMPLLGLEALMANGLKLSVNGRKSRFSIEQCITHWLRDFYDDCFT